MCFWAFKKKGKPIQIPEPCGKLDINEVSSILLDKMEENGDSRCELYLPDTECKVYRKQGIIDYLGLDETDGIAYVAEEMDCDDFAAILFGKFAGLLWTNVHAFNWFIDENWKLWFIEPQSDKIADRIENWQGAEVRFFLGR